MKINLVYQPYAAKKSTWLEKMNMTLQNLRWPKTLIWKSDTIFTTLHNQPETQKVKKMWPNEKHKNLKIYFLQTKTQNAKLEYRHF